MKSKAESRYRLELAEGFYAEANQDFELSRWRSCVDNSQLAVENSGKTVIACFRPVEKSHNPAKQVKDYVVQRSIIGANARKCPDCGKEVESNKKFCNECGARL